MSNELDSSLANLMGAYYHQDWPDFGGSVWDPLEEYLSESPRALTEQLLHEVTDLLNRDMEDSDLLSVLQELSGNLVKSDMPDGARAWLLEMMGRIQQSLDAADYARAQGHRTAG